MMSRLACHLAAFALVVAAYVSPALAVTLPEQPASETSGDGTTRHVLALTWQPGFCLTRPTLAECAPEGRGAAPGRLSLHGLWQVRKSYCGIDAELKRHSSLVSSYVGRCVNNECRVLDTLALARQMHPGQRNNLDALCKRYSIDNSHRELHGALLDARILADVYLAMTGGQVGLALGVDEVAQAAHVGQVRALVRPAVPLVVISASDDELKLHEGMLATIAKASKGKCLWQALEDIENLRRDCAATFNIYDVLITPAAAALPWPAREAFPPTIAGQPVGPRGHAVFTGWVNAAGLPALAVPAAPSSSGLPIGIQLIGAYGADVMLLELGEAYEAVAPWADRWPDL